MNMLFLFCFVFFKYYKKYNKMHYEILFKSHIK